VSDKTKNEQARGGHGHDLDEILREFESRKNRSSSRRVGHRERSIHQEFVNEAYAAGYLDDDELAARVAKIQEAKYVRDLNNVTDDLPSYAELKGREAVPAKVQKWNLVKFYTEDHAVLGPIISLILSILIAVIPSNVIFSLHVNQLFPFPMIVAFTIIIGAVCGFASLFRLLWVLFEDC